MTQITPGTRIGDYEVGRPLGAGGMGAVYVARQSRTGVEVALKVMHAEAASSNQLKRRFLREGRVTMALQHPNVIRILECFEHGGQPVLAMEVLHGCSLTESLQREPQPGLARTAAILVRVTSAVGTAHALGLVHRDLKPDNIFLLDTDPRVKVLDFGIAKMRKGFGLEESSALTRTGMLVGTPYYMSPEQAFGEKSIDHRSDIWSLGLILYEALLGVLPTKADTLQEVLRRLMSMNFARLDAVDPSIPKDVADLVERMTSRDRAARPTDLREVYAVLARHADRNQAAQLGFATAPLSFASAAAPIPIDEPTDGATLALDRPTGPATVALDGQPTSAPASLKLTPRSLQRSESPAVSSRTLVLDQPASAAGAAIAAPSARGAPSSGASVRAPDPRTGRRAGLWMWIVAALVIVACAAVLIKQLR